MLYAFVVGSGCPLDCLTRIIAIQACGLPRLSGSLKLGVEVGGLAARQPMRLQSLKNTVLANGLLQASKLKRT
jgi:hypothetical protein